MVKPTAIIVLALLAVAAPAVSADLTTAAAAWQAEDFVKAYEELKVLAADQDADALFLLGLMHDRGLGVPRDKAEAFFWYRAAAAQGHEVSRSAIGSMHLLGSGAPKDHDRAAVWFRDASERGNVIGQYNLGVAFHTGSGVGRDYERAAHWYRMAAERGLADGQFQLASMQFLGQGIAPDYVDAYYWFTRASEGGRADAAEVRNLLSRLMSEAQIWEAEDRLGQWREAARTAAAGESP